MTSVIRQAQRHGRLIGACVGIYVFENISYFVVGTLCGQLWGLDHAVNLMWKPIDAIIPWFTPLYLYYFIWPLLFFIIIPAVLWKVGGRRGVALYVVVSVAMYIAGTIIYAVFPTTYTPMDFINGTYASLPKTDVLYWAAMMTCTNSTNVYGAFPSYHNFWGALLVVLPIILMRQHRSASPAWAWASIALGAAISLATLLLHQHAILDAVLTYLLTCLIYAIAARTGMYERAERWLFPPARGA